MVERDLWLQLAGLEEDEDMEDRYELGDEDVDSCDFLPDDGGYSRELLWGLSAVIAISKGCTVHLAKS